MPENEKDNLTVQECIASQTIIMKVNGNNVTLQFASERNDEVYKEVKKILLRFYMNKKM